MHASRWAGSAQLNAAMSAAFARTDLSVVSAYSCQSDDVAERARERLQLERLLRSEATDAFEASLAALVPSNEQHPKPKRS